MTAYMGRQVEMCVYFLIKKWRIFGDIRETKIMGLFLKKV